MHPRTTTLTPAAAPVVACGPPAGGSHLRAARPAAFGQVVTFREAGADAWRVALSDPVLDATSAVAAADQRNRPAPEGMVYATVTVNVTRLGARAAAPWIDLSVEFVSAAGSTHSSADVPAVGPAPSLLDLNGMHAGAAGAGNVVIAIPAADVTTGTGTWAVSSIFGDSALFALR